MSVLEFISSLKWPITILLLATAGYVIAKRDHGLRAFIKHLLANRNMRISLPFVEAELTKLEEAAELAAQSDEQLEQVAAERSEEAGGPDATGLRREAIEQLVREVDRATRAVAGLRADAPVPRVFWRDSHARITFTRPGPPGEEHEEPNVEELEELGEAAADAEADRLAKEEAEDRRLGGY